LVAKTGYSYIILKGYQTSHIKIKYHQLRAGRHYVTFVIGGTDIHCAQVGLIRPLKKWDKKGLECFDPKDNDLFDELQQERTESWGNSNVHLCRITVWGVHDIVLTCSWSRTSNNEHLWEREEEEFASGDRVGMLLDFDAGKLSVYRNGRRAGTISAPFSGEYCWYGAITTPGPDIRIEKGSIPI